MSTVAQHYFQTLRNSPVQELLAMIERRAPILMRAGGLVGNSREVPEHYGKRVRPEIVAKMKAMVLAGHSLKEIAAATGYHSQCCATYTREERGARLRGPRKR